MAKYNVGDRVVVRNDLKTGVQYGIDNAVPEMLEFRGKELEVLEIDSSGEYTLSGENNIWSWTDEMLDDERRVNLVGLKDLRVGDKVRVRRDLELGKCGNDAVVSQMLEYAGKEVTISRVCDVQGEKKYTIKDVWWNWTPEMFEEIVDRSMVNVVYVKFENSDKPYLYEVPVDVKLYENEVVFVEVDGREMYCVTVTDSVMMNVVGVDMILQANGVKKPIKRVTGRGKMTYKNIGFDA